MTVRDHLEGSDIVTPVGPDSLDPALRAYIDHVHANAPGGVDLRELPIAEARRIVNTRLVEANPDQDLAVVRDERVPAPGGGVGVRVYAAPGASGTVVFAHGGIWAFGNLDTHDGLCRQVADRSRAVVVSVDYRISPEHAYPAAVDDIAAVVQWVVAQRGREGTDSAVALLGDSAGGTIAAQYLLERTPPLPVAGLAMICPAVDPVCDSLSFRIHATGLLLGAEDIRWAWKLYLGPGSADRVSTAPGSGADLARLPPMLVQTAGQDVLCDEGDDFARRAAAAGVDVKASRYEAVVHGFYELPHVVPGFRAIALAELTRWLRRRLDA